MSRIGFKNIEIPNNVNLNINNENIKISGPKGTLDIKIIYGIYCEYKDNILKVKRLNDNYKKYHGTMRSLISNAVFGVTNGFEKKLEIHGIGYRANMQGEVLCLNIGYSHPVYIKPNNNSKIICNTITNITVEGIDKQAVGQTAALIRSVRVPEPYKGKGICYVGEKIIRKEGKKIISSGGGTSATATKNKK